MYDYYQRNWLERKSRERKRRKRDRDRIRRENENYFNYYDRQIANINQSIINQGYMRDVYQNAILNQLR